MMAATSGSLVPPTALSSGCSQNLVTPTGRMDQASKVSVTEGTRLTTRGNNSEPVQQFCLGCLELRLRQDAALAELVELLDLLGDRQTLGQSGGPGLAGLAAFHLPVDLVLDPARPGEIGEHLLAPLPGRLDG